MFLFRVDFSEVQEIFPSQKNPEEELSMSLTLPGSHLTYTFIWVNYLAAILIPIYLSA
jgi:hypothetical protein